MPRLSRAKVAHLELFSTQADAQRRKREWDRRPSYAVATLSLLSVALTYSLSVNFLSMFESTMCLKIAGGAGC